MPLARSVNGKQFLNITFLFLLDTAAVPVLVTVIVLLT